MAIKINIGSTVIEFPESGQDPNWAPALVEFAQATAEVLSSVSGPFDVPTQYLNIDAYNPGVNIDLPNFSFPTSDVRGASLILTIKRSTTTESVSEWSNLDIVYNEGNLPGQKWEISRDFTGDASISFNITDSGQVTFTTETLSGLNHTGVISYAAKSLLQDN